MRIAVAANDNLGLDGVVSAHFGRCPYYTLTDVGNGKVQGIKVVNNPFYGSHGQQGEVPSFIHTQQASVIIAGGMGPRAIGYFNQFGIEVVTGASGSRIGDVVNSYLDGKLFGARSCRETEGPLRKVESHGDELLRLKEELASLQQRLADTGNKIAELEQRQH